MRAERPAVGEKTVAELCAAVIIARMSSHARTLAFGLFLVVSGQFSAGGIWAQVAQPATNPPAVFTDPDRRVKLNSAFPEIDKAIGEFMTRTHVPGAAWGIVIDGELAHLGVAGFRDLDKKSPVDKDSVFRIASMTKSFTAMSILKLRDEGKLSLDDLAEKYVPELKNLHYPTSDSPRIKIRDLMSHAAGFPEDNPWGDQQLDRTEEQLTDMLSQGIPFSNAPQTAYEYSNYGFAILGRIVSRVSGKPYPRYVQEAILRPLGMTSTTLQPSEVPKDRLAYGYRWEDQKWKLEPALPDGAFGSMGGMLTSVADLSKYVGAFLAAWPPRDGVESGPVRRSSLREMQQIWRSRPATVSRLGTGSPNLNAGGYGYGLGISQNCDYAHIVAHSGGLPGYGSLMRWLPEYGVGIVAFGNVTYTGWGGVVNNAFDMLAKTGGLERRTPQPSDALVAARDAFSRLVLRWDDAQADKVAAMNLFLDVSKDRRQKQIDELKSKVGACTAPPAFENVENALRGSWLMKCERGDLRVSITLAPTMPPKVQFMEVTAPPPGASPPPTSACRM
jgi:CubicO group peptidase (beta-lactamase class C family)